MGALLKVSQMTHAHRNNFERTEDVGGFNGYGKLPSLTLRCSDIGQYDAADPEIRVNFAIHVD
jgi:hypothetical protein